MHNAMPFAGNNSSNMEIGMEAQFNITTMKKAGVSILKPKHNYKYFEKLSYSSTVELTFVD